MKFTALFPKGLAPASRHKWVDHTIKYIEKAKSGAARSWGGAVVGGCLRPLYAPWSPP